MPPTSTGIVLAGGASTRMGSDKALLEIEGETLLARTVRVLREVVTEVLVVGRTDLPAALRGTASIRDDCVPGGPLGGIVTGLAHMTSECAVIVACDLPLLRVELLRMLLDLAPGYDAVVPCPGHVPGDGHSSQQQEGHSGHPQPTCAVYARKCGPLLRIQLDRGQYRLTEALTALHVRWVQDEEITRVDPQGLSFVNVNTPAAWELVARAAAPRRHDQT